MAVRSAHAWLPASAGLTAVAAPSVMVPVPLTSLSITLRLLLRLTQRGYASRVVRVLRQPAINPPVSTAGKRHPH